METFKKKYKGETYEVLLFDFIEKDGSHHGGAEVTTNDFWEKMLWDEEKEDFKGDDEADFDHTFYGYIDIPKGTTIELLMKTNNGREILEEAVKDMDGEIVKIY